MTDVSPILVMFTLSAFSTTHRMVEVWPLLMVRGVAEKRIIRGGPPAPTVTTTPQLSDTAFVPAVAVMVYAVVVVGETMVEPVLATVPTPGEILTESAVGADQNNVAASPATMDAGCA